mgnify:FL=1
MNGTKLWLSNLQKNYFSFEGSIQRKEYITRMIILFLLGLFCAFIASVIALGLGLVSNLELNLSSQYIPDTTAINDYLLINIGTWSGTFLFLLVTAISIILEPLVFIAQISLCVRRFHDLNLSGFFVLLGLIPIVCPIMIILLGVLPSRKQVEI